MSVYTKGSPSWYTRAGDLLTTVGAAQAVWDAIRAKRDAEEDGLVRSSLVDRMKYIGDDAVLDLLQTRLISAERFCRVCPCVRSAVPADQQREHILRHLRFNPPRCQVSEAFVAGATTCEDLASLGYMEGTGEADEFIAGRRAPKLPAVELVARSAHEPVDDVIFGPFESVVFDSSGISLVKGYTPLFNWLKTPADGELLTSDGLEFEPRKYRSVTAVPVMAANAIMWRM